MVYGSVGYGIDDLDEVADAVSIDGVAEGELCLDLVSFRDGYLAHVVTEADEFGALPVVPAGCGAGPCVEGLEGVQVLPVPGDHSAVEAHAAHDEAELPVAMGALVKVHEVHIDVLPRDVAIELGVQVYQRLLQHFQTADPHFGRGEGVHPGDNANAVRGGVGLLAGLVDLFR